MEQGHLLLQDGNEERQRSGFKLAELFGLQ